MIILAFFEEKMGANENIEWMLLTLAIIALAAWMMTKVVGWIRGKGRNGKG